jgi:hypothetical protein
LSTERSRPNTATRVRYAIYAAAVTIAALLVVDAVITSLEASGVLDTARADDGAPLALDPWIEDGEWWVPANRGPFVMADHRFARDKAPNALRVFMVGASFMQGVPYTGKKTMHHALETLLRLELPERKIEVANGSLSAQDSGMVVKLAEWSLKHAPDVLVVATCNNEGTLPPSKVTSRLQELGTFRALRSVLKGEAESRPVHTPVDPDLQAVRSRYRTNLETIVARATAAGVPVILATLPVNLRYEGDEAGLPIAGHSWEEAGTVALPTCAVAVKNHLAARRYPEAEQAAAACGEVEALRWLGLTKYARHDYPEAQRLLEAYVELMPRNRCRPSFNTIIRQVAKASPNATLLDLDRFFRDLRAHGLPGPEDFTDYCHLFEDAQRKAGDAMAYAVLSLFR